jgi:nucleotide-binding universal stress UspA family protein
MSAKDDTPLELKHVLCPTDFSEACHRALDVAADLAAASRAELGVLHVLPTFPPLGPEVMYQPSAGMEAEELALLNQDLARFAERAAAKCSVRCLLKEGDAADEILREMDESSVDLVVMGQNSREGVGGWILGSVTERVVRRSHRPVLVVPPDLRSRSASHPQRILCGLELEKASAATLSYAARWASFFDAQLSLLHVVDSPEGDHWARTSFEIPEYWPMMVKDAKERMTRLLESTGVRSSEQRVLRGKPHRRVLEVVRTLPADLLVIGSHAGGIFDSQFLGTTVRRLLREAPCPVLVVPSRVKDHSGERPVDHTQLQQA